MPLYQIQQFAITDDIIPKYTVSFNCLFSIALLVSNFEKLCM